MPVTMSDTERMSQVSTSPTGSPRDLSTSALVNEIGAEVSHLAHKQYTKDAEEESPESYLDAIDEFEALLQVGLPQKPTDGPSIGRAVSSKSRD